MDPALQELIEGGADDDIEAIIRLEPGHPPPPHVRIVARFGDIATCRLPRRRIAAAWADDAVISLKAARPFGLDPDPIADTESPAPENDNIAQPGDARRPAWLPETGRGVVVGVIDWGFDFAHPNFRNPDGSTRALAIWDQSPLGQGPQPYGYGRVFRREDINRALAAEDPYLSLGYHPASGDPTGRGSHGTHVLDIACGNGRAPGSPVGMAPGSDLLFVHLSTRGTGGLASLGDSVTLLEGLHWMVQEAGDRPIVINLSVGRHGGPHHGLTLVEQGIDALLAERPGRCVCQSAGNYFEARTHASGRLRPGQRRLLSWWTEEADLTPNELEIWYPGEDIFGVELLPPGDSTPVRVPLGRESAVMVEGQEVGRIYHRARDPAAGDNHIDIFLYARAPAGNWIVTLGGDDVVDGRWHAWVERDAACPSCQSRLAADDADPVSTIGTIANGFRAIAVGAYDAQDRRLSLARFSSSGPTRDGRTKPDLVAPGVRVLAARSCPLSSSQPAPPLFRQSGTSMAAPHVTGTVALLFEAAGTRLPIQETRRLLLSTTARYPGNAAAERLGNGMLDVEAAVAAARPDATETAAPVETGPPDYEGERLMSRIVAEPGSTDCDCGAARSQSLEREGQFVESLVDPVRWNASSPFAPANLFDAAVRGGHSWERVASAFEVVAMPGTMPQVTPRSGDFLVRRVLGEGSLADLQILTDVESIPAGRLPLDRLVLRPRIGEMPDAVEQAVAPDSSVANRFVAAHATRFCSPGQRGSATCVRLASPRPIRRVIIHALAVPSTARRTGVEAVVAGWLTRGRTASAHYLVDRDGTITQMVREADVAFHTPGNNADSLGIEHADVCNDPAPLTTALYERSAELVRDLGSRHGFALDAAGVMGHQDANPNHGDPGPYWDWEYYRLLLAWDGTTQASRPIRIVVSAASQPAPATGWQAERRRAIANDRCASRRDPWGERYFRARPSATGTPATITAAVDHPGRYRVSLWWPDVAGANPDVSVDIEVAGGSRQSVAVSQRPNAGRWNDVAEVDIPTPPSNLHIRFNRASPRPGWILADAVRLLRIGPVPTAPVERAQATLVEPAEAADPTFYATGTEAWPEVPPLELFAEAAPPCQGSPTIIDGFPTSTTVLNQEQRAKIALLASDIASSQSGDNPVQSICLVGHTDSAGTPAQNLDLGSRRAQAVETELRVALDRIQVGVSTRLNFGRDSKGESSPIASNTTADSRARNRRVEITVGRGEGLAAPRIEPADTEAEISSETFADQVVGGAFIVTLGTTGREFVTRAGGPFLEWSTGDPSVARVSPISDSQSLPNRVTVFGLRAGITDLRVRARSAGGASRFASVQIVVTGVGLSLHGPDGHVGTRSAELVRPAPAVPNGVAERGVEIQLQPAAFWSGKQVAWSFQDEAGVRGALPAGRTRLARVQGFDFTAATGRSVVAANGRAQVLISMPSVAFNRGRLTVTAVDDGRVRATTAFEVPGIVAIDPGHGGHFQLHRRAGGACPGQPNRFCCTKDSSDNNATGIGSGTLEKALTLDMAFKIRRALDASPRLIHAPLTRDSDVNLALSDRARFAQFKGADIMLCIHFNAAERNNAPDPGPHGPVVFVRRAADNVNLAQDRALAGRISARLRALRPSNRADHVVEDELGVLSDPHLGNTAAHHPTRAVLVEVDFITNPAADTFFQSDNNRTTAANAIAEAVAEDLALQP